MTSEVNDLQFVLASRPQLSVLSPALFGMVSPLNLVT